MNADHKSRAGLAEARRILPSFVERTSYGTYESNPYSKLFEERIIFIGTPIDDAVANDIRHHTIHSPTYSDVPHGTGCRRGRTSVGRRSTR
jgi:hypothetical protein